MVVAEKASSEPRHRGRIRDARGREVTQLDPVAMHLLGQHDVIDSDTLRAIVAEPGVRIEVKERAFLVAGLCGALLIIGFFFVEGLVTGGLRDAPFAKSSSLMFACFVPWIIWYKLKRARFGKVAAAMLKYLHCPHCGYDLRLLPTDPADGATVCPECGCAWRLE